ncbi:MAG TPA: 3-methyladenine DNA glycosylase [Dermatophilaceae bacterium]|nr:3-methyladenine DNA glycosylase [Dermatophilaceae bacterium]
MRTLDRESWQTAQTAHAARVDALTEGHRQRQHRHEAHPVEDFLFTYYPYPVSRLRRWHPGAGVRLAGAATAAQAGWRHYRVVGDDAEVDVAAFLQDRLSTVRFVSELLTRTAERPAQLGCLGLHEWAMVYRQSPEQVRHTALPLRLGSAGTDAVVETHALRCTHADAFRFFTEPARPRNAVQPTRERQVELEQPGCLHATMDLYKWAVKLAPVVPSELTADCFELARDVRSLDMRASPYDVRALGYPPVCIETPEGKAVYVAEQREYAARGAALRARLLAVLTALEPAQRQ